MGLRDVIISALTVAALALPSCRYQNMQATNADNQSTPYYDLECHLEAGYALDFQQDVAFSFSPYGCSCNPRMSYAVGTDGGLGLERRFELDFELSASGDTHVHAISGSVEGPEHILMYSQSNPEATMQAIPIQCGTTEEQGIRARMISMWSALWPLFYDESRSDGGLIMDHMFRVCVEDDIMHQAELVREENFIIIREY